MKRPRFLAAVALPGGALSRIRRGLGDVLASNGAGEAICDDGGLVVLAAGAVQRLGSGSAVIGPLFRRGDSGLRPLNEDERDAVRETRGAWLIEERWGGYLAILAHPGGVSLVRAPFGDLPCYWTIVDRIFLAASDLALLLSAGMACPALDPPALAAFLAAEDLSDTGTCLSGIRELRGGQRLTISGGEVAEKDLWSPWTYAARDRQVRNRDAAATGVRDSVLDCVAARASEVDAVLLKLSGGLDSSLVAAALSRSGRQCTALTLATEDPASDERSHARLVARAAGLPLVERFRQLAGVNLDRSGAARLPRPTARSFIQESQRIASEVAASSGCDAVFDGGGGDHIFCSLQSARPAADCLLGNGGKGFWLTTASIAELAQASIWQVAWRALLASLRRKASYRLATDLRFLSAAAKAWAEAAPAHPWLHAPAGALPGKAAHVALIAGARGIAEWPDPEERLPACSPLVSQPVVEACLSAPSWLWFERGRNRALARRGFASLLPEAVLWRRSKGAPDAFIAGIYESNRPRIRELLLEGALRRLALIDAGAIEAALADERPLRGHDFLRLMRLTDAEAWARYWS